MKQRIVSTYNILRKKIVIDNISAHNIYFIFNLCLLIIMYLLFNIKLQYITICKAYFI